MNAGAAVSADKESESWSKKEDLFLSKQALSGPVVSKNDKYTSIAFSTDKTKSFVEFYSTNGRSVKSSTSRKLEDSDESRCIRKLGPCPKGLFSSNVIDPRSTAFPSSISQNYFVCASLDLHSKHKPKSKRRSYVVKSSEANAEPCPFAFVVRNFDEGISLLTFAKGHHVHNCEGKNSHYLPYTAEEKLFFLRGVMRCGSVKAFHDEVLVPRSNEAFARGTAIRKMDIMDLPAAQKLAQELGVDLSVKAGENDFDRVRESLVQHRCEGATIAFKLSGWTCKHAKAIVHPSAEEFLQPDDLFILLSTRMQLELLSELGTMAATDGTHSIFKYNNIKVIVVLVTSFTRERTMKERGFPVCVVLTTSEREDIHKAIVAHLLASVPTWRPQLLMTDMAFSAFNAWVAFFPGLHWLWCVFHVLQAWLKRLRTIARPDWISKDDWSTLKGFLIREIKDLISPKDGSLMSQSEYECRCAIVSSVLWINQLKDLASSWDSYVSNANRWSPPARRKVVEEVFSTSEHMPMLAKSNNCLEAFFGVLKYFVLDGRPLETATEFFNLLNLYQARIVRNVVLYGVLAHLVEKRNVEAVESDVFAVEEELHLDSEEDNGDEEDIVEDDPEHEQANREEDKFDNLRRKVEEKNVLKELKLLVENLESAMSETRKIGDAPITAKQLRFLNRTIENWRDAAIAINSDETYDASKIKMSRESKDFVRQRVNYAPPITFTPRVLPGTPVSSSSGLTPMPSLKNNPLIGQLASSPSSAGSFEDPPSIVQAPVGQLAFSSSSASLIQGSTGSGTMNAATAPNPCLTVGSTAVVGSAGTVSTVAPGSLSNPDNTADYGALYKKKRKTSSKSHSRTSLPELSFRDYAARWLSDPGAHARIEELKRTASSASLPLLRAALKWNTCNRIRAIALDVFNQTFPQSVNKEELISRLMVHVLGCCAELPREVNDDVADVGMCQTPCQRLNEHEVIFLERNGNSNFGEPCVTTSEHLSGWVMRNGEFVRIGFIVAKNICWGKLVEKKKDVTIYDT